jgi:hypothetical protein
MPFKSEKQRRWMHANKPKMARRWEAEEKSNVGKSNKSTKRRKAKA